MMGLFLVLVAIICLTSHFLFKKLLANIRLQGLPPGPKGLPLLGNIFDMPSSTEKAWLHWLKFKELYGPVSSVTVLGQPIIVLNDYDSAVELLEKNSALSANRPMLTFGGEMVGWNNFLPCLQNGDTFRKHRRYLRQFMGTRRSIEDLKQKLEVETRRFLSLTLCDPTSWRDYIGRTTGAIILSITYGYNVDRARPDQLNKLGDQGNNIFKRSIQPGDWIVDMLPILRHFPEWLPGMRFKRIAREWSMDRKEFIDRPYQFSKQTFDSGDAPLSYVSTLLASAPSPPSAEDESCIKWSAGAIYGGGNDTTNSSMCTFFLAMVLHPNVQRAAQKEIDSVVGVDRLPTLDDRSRLPYVDAVMKECFRWNVVLPMGLPHLSVEDYMYRGLLIPKNAIVLANLWEFSHNSQTYRNPELFNPERFLETSDHKAELDPIQYIFGFGRRICPGKELAVASMWLTVANSLAVFNIGKTRDITGSEVTPSAEFGNGFVCYPESFPCSITPRSSGSESLVRSVDYEYPYEKSDSEALARVKWGDNFI